MKNLSRVVWNEGMYLGPQHFQLQNRYFEDSIRFVTSALWFAPYGLAGFGLDAEALRNGTLAALHARGVFPDGLAFQMPEADPLPPPRNITDLFPPARDKVTIHLAIPSQKSDGLNCIPIDESATGPTTRFWAEPHVLYDETTGRDEKPVKLGRKNIRLLLDFELAEDDVTLPIARVTRDGSGRFVFDPEFVPPCLEVAGSERLMMVLRRLIEILEEKSAALSAHKRSSGKSWAEYSTTDLARFWMLHSVNSAIPPLRNLFQSKRGHPEQLYAEMARLAGSLCTFAVESHPRDVPLYNHAHLDETFTSLDIMIRRLLEILVPTNVITIPLRKFADYFYEGEVSDQRCLDRAQWIFAVNSSIGEAPLITLTPQLAKVCSRRWVPELVKRALGGLPMNHQSLPPSSVSRRIDWQYFSITRHGPCWDDIVKTRQVGVYVPGELPDPQIELLVVLE